jgi:hypothetical protein
MTDDDYQYEYEYEYEYEESVLFSFWLIFDL